MRTKGLVAVMLVLGLVLSVAPAGAQDTGRVGLTVAHPASVGLIWHAADRVALRADMSVTWTTSESESTSGLFPLSSSGEGHAVGVGGSVLVYLQGPGARFRSYVVPRAGYTRGRTTNESSVGFESRTTTTGAVWSLSYGAQYLATDRFGLFGEAGLGGASSRLSSSASQSRTRSHSWGTRGGVGVTIYF